MEARKRRKDAALDEWLLAALRKAKAQGSGPGVPRDELIFAERQRN